LPGFATLQFTAMQRLPRGFSVRGVVENLLDRQYLVGFSPTPTIGSPRLVRFGVRWH
jgi:outer membrane receptor protein involved in Fe transport